jgi:hypothetical protein
MSEILPVISAIFALPAGVLPEGQLTQSDSCVSQRDNCAARLAVDLPEAGVVVGIAPIAFSMLWFRGGVQVYSGRPLLQDQSRPFVWAQALMQLR